MHPKVKDGYAQMGEHVFGWNMQAYSRFSKICCPTVTDEILTQRRLEFNKTKNRVLDMVNATNKPNMGKTDMVDVKAKRCEYHVSLEIGVLEASL